MIDNDRMKATNRCKAAGPASVRRTSESAESMQAHFEEVSAGFKMGPEFNPILTLNDKKLLQGICTVYSYAELSMWIRHKSTHPACRWLGSLAIRVGIPHTRVNTQCIHIAYIHVSTIPSMLCFLKKKEILCSGSQRPSEARALMDFSRSWAAKPPQPSRVGPPLVQLGEVPGPEVGV